MIHDPFHVCIYSISYILFCNEFTVMHALYCSCVFIIYIHFLGGESSSSTYSIQAKMEGGRFARWEGPCESVDKYPKFEIRSECHFTAPARFLTYASRADDKLCFSIKVGITHKKY